MLLHLRPQQAGLRAENMGSMDTEKHSINVHFETASSSVLQHPQEATALTAGGRRGTT